MNIPTIKECVIDSKVIFLRYQQGELWYKCDNGFEFPVPISDTGSGAFLPEDKAVYFMRWIRNHLVMLQNALAEQRSHITMHHALK